MAATHLLRPRGGSGRESGVVGNGPVNEVAEQVLLTNYKALEMYMSECHTIRRESGVYEPPNLQESPQSSQQPQHRRLDRRHASPGDSARGTDHESSEEEGTTLSYICRKKLPFSQSYKAVE